MWETVISLRALHAPGTMPLHLPWVSEARMALEDVDLGPAFALVGKSGYMPDFMTPPPSSPLADFGEELELVRATSAAQVQKDVEIILRQRPAAALRGTTATLRVFHEHPRRALARLCDLLEELWRRAHARHWPRVRAMLEADLAYRARRLTEGGVARLFTDLHRTVRWRRDGAELDHPWEETLALEGRGLLLVPTAFGSERPAAMTEPPWQPTLVYPARGVALLWEVGEKPAARGLGGVVGSTRARILAELDAPRSTTDIARLLELTPGAVSQHLAALREAGLVSGQRDGRLVLYVRTPVAEQLVGAAGETFPQRAAAQ
jgi:DNA-binding transcriptional ArsR family regulator